MKDLLEAFTIFNKYISGKTYPTHCEHDVMSVQCDPEIVSDEDKARLQGLGFIIGSGDNDGCFVSFRFGSA